MQSYKEFGLSLCSYVDRQFLFEAGSWTVKLYKLFKQKNGIKPLDWQGKHWPQHYQNQTDLLWVLGRDSEKLYLPQSVLIAPDLSPQLLNSLKIRLIDKDFLPPYKNQDGLKYYKKSNSYNELTARLASYEDGELVFQGCGYFDWLETNLSADLDRSPLPTLREDACHDYALKQLNDTKLANISGINGLLFTNDGYMIYQKRSSDVLVRPGQLCSGFSGTIDKIDIENVCRSPSPVLADLDTVREAVEEVGIDRTQVNDITFLGLTRELIRAGTPEFFYSVKLNISRDEVLKLLPKDREGVIKDVEFGSFAENLNDNSGSLSHETLWKLLDKIEKNSKAPVSIPFLTNLVLWYWSWNKQAVGVGEK